MSMPADTNSSSIHTSTEKRAEWIANKGNLEAAFKTGAFSKPVSLPLAEALVLGLLRQGVRKYLVIFGHGSTALGEVLRIYESVGLIRGWQFRNEVEMAHAATALRWTYGEVCALITSIGPGALQAMAGSLSAASNGIGLYHIYGDETTYGEGYNMQQIPKPAQGLFGQMTGLMGQSYTLHTPEALRQALRLGAACVFHPYKAGPFYLNLPINTQPVKVRLRMDALPITPTYSPTLPAMDTPYQEACDLIRTASRIAIKAGGGARFFAKQVRRLAEKTSAVVVESPGCTGVLPYAHPQNMHVGGSKGSISGNYAMREAELLIAIGTRAVCQSDCSGIGWRKARAVININADLVDVQHYNRTLALNGDIGAIIPHLLSLLPESDSDKKQAWLTECVQRKEEWARLKSERCRGEGLFDPIWNQKVLTQPQAIRIVADFCKRVKALKYFDAGDVQANGFQIVEDDTPFDTITETGASYMGFAPSALIAGAIADKKRYAVAFAGDGSFMMNPQVLIDAVQHRLHGTLVIFDNRRMAAISQLQLAQYGKDYRTHDSVVVDYVALASAVQGVLALDGGESETKLARALERAFAHKGFSIIHVPVYHGSDDAGSMGAYGEWNVGNWCAEVQDAYLNTPL